MIIIVKIFIQFFLSERKIKITPGMAMKYVKIPKVIEPREPNVVSIIPKMYKYFFFI